MHTNVNANCTELVIKAYHLLYDDELSIVNLNDLAGRLSQMVNRDRPWTGKYLHSLIKGYAGFSPNQQLLDALVLLISHLENTDEVLERVQETTVLTVNPLPPGTVILGEAQRCANPGCNIIFVPTHPRQKYHSKYCARAVQRQTSSKRPRANESAEQR